MKKIITCLMLFNCLSSRGQNMVHNSSFEHEILCPSGREQISQAAEWFPVGSGADYFDSCCIGCVVGVPFNQMGYRPAYPGGHAYAGIYLYKEYTANYRDYLQGILDPLVPGHWYRVKLHLSGSSQVQYECRTPGVFFYINQTIPTTNQVLPFTPQSQYISQTGDDTLNWTSPNQIFYADSAYTKLLIGNFNDDAHSSINHVFFYYPFTPEAHAAYTYVDEISVVDITAAYLAGLEQEQQIVTIAPNPFTDNTTLSFSNPQSQPYTLSIYNMQGMLLRTISNITGSELTLQRDGLPAAYYFYRLSNNSDAVATGKLLIQ